MPKSRGRSAALVAVAGTVAIVLLLPAAAAAKKPSPQPPPPSFASSTWVRDYANVVDGVQSDLTPADVQATADGGSIDLALTPAPSGAHPGMSWLMKADGVGKPQWQEEIGCAGSAPGDYADTLSSKQTSDGGYVLAGGTLGCGSATQCPDTSGIQCGLVERLDGSGRIEWADVYSAGTNGTSFRQIAQTSDGGFVAVGNATNAGNVVGALIVKLDALGSVQWARELGPSGATQAMFEAVTPTSDGGTVATGELYTPTTGATPTSILVAKFDGSGDLVWQRGFAGTRADGTPSTEKALSVVQRSDGGLAIGGSWYSATSPGTCCSGGLLLRLDPTGALQSQTAYSGGVYCFSNGYSETCTAAGGVVYSLRQTVDGGYLLAGDAPLELLDSVTLVPWLAKTDASGALVWQENAYQVNPATQRPLGEYFASAAITPAGYLAAGWTENLSNGLGELFSVQTDPSGAVGTCSQIHPASTLAATDPALTAVAPGLAATTPAVARDTSSAQAQPTSVTTSAAQC